MTVEYFDRNGKRITMMSWARAMENPKYRVLASTNIEHYVVSTVWFGIDMDVMNLIREEPAPPMMFESAIFVVPQGNDRWESLELRRYRTEQEAMVGHTELVHTVQMIVDAEKEVMNDVEERADLRPLLGDRGTEPDSDETPRSAT